MLQQAERINPEHCNAPYNLGTTLIRLARSSEALETLSRALACYEREGRVGAYVADTHFNQGVALANLGRYPEAEAHFRMCLQIAPDYPGGASRSAMSWPGRERGCPGTPRAPGAIMVEPLHEKPFTVRYYEVGPSRLVRPATLLDYLQDAAAEHASLLSIGVQELHHRDLTWVLSRLRLTVDRYPGVGETVLVRTWPSTRGSLSSYREFEVLDQAGGIVARATTAWVVLDLVRRRPVRLAELLPDYPLEPRRAIGDDFPPLPRPAPSGREVRFTVRQSDLDMNRHVNNAVYVGWALEAAPAEVAENGGPVDIEVGYRAEALAGDTIAARCAPEADAGQGRFLHEIIREEDGRELARLRVRWA